MRIQTDQGEFELQLIKATPSQSPAHPDLQVAVSAIFGQYSVQGTSAWLEWADIEAFIIELEALIKNGKGKAQLSAMSPRDLTLEIFNLDSLGHLGVTISVGSRAFTSNGQFQCGLHGGLELDLLAVEPILIWFREAITPNSSKG